jgi:hypothetical protein
MDNDLFKKIKESTEEETRTYKITGNKDTLDHIEKFLKTCEWLGNVGASREIKFGADGDGDFRPKVEGLSSSLKDYKVGDYDKNGRDINVH